MKFVKTVFTHTPVSREANRVDLKPPLSAKN